MGAALLSTAGRRGDKSRGGDRGRDVERFGDGSFATGGGEYATGGVCRTGTSDFPLTMAPKRGLAGVRGEGCINIVGERGVVASVLAVSVVSESIESQTVTSPMVEAAGD